MFLFVFFFFPLTVFAAPIIDVMNFECLKNSLKATNENDLIVFDIDCTLIIPKDKVLRPCGKDFFLKHFTKFAPTLPPQQIELLLSIILQNSQIELVDEEMPALIKFLQTRSKVIAITTLPTEHFGTIKNLEDWKHNKLIELGFDFSSSFPHYNHIVFGDLMDEGGLPIFKNGILVTDGLPKAELLKELIRRVKWQPRRIFFIDDALTNIQAVRLALEYQKIECICLHYLKAENLPDELNAGIANQQFMHLCHHGTWQSDVEAARFQYSSEAAGR